MSKFVSLGERLEMLREEQNLTKNQIAKKIDISRVTYDNYITGRRTPDCSVIIAFCREFKVSADYLLGLSQTRNPSYAKVAETTGLNEESILYLERMSRFLSDETVDIINLLINEEPDTAHLDWPIPPPPPMSAAELEAQYNEYTDWLNGRERPILNVLSEEWEYQDYHSKMSEEEMIAQAMEEQTKMKEFYDSMPALTKEAVERAVAGIKKQDAFFEREWRKSNLLSRINDYLSYREGCSLRAFGQEERLSDDRQICLGIGKNTINFPSRESNELFEFMLTQKIIDALKIFKKNYWSHKG